MNLGNIIWGIVMLDEGYKGGWHPLSLEAKIDAKRLALKEGVHEGEPEMCFLNNLHYTN